LRAGIEAVVSEAILSHSGKRVTASRRTARRDLPL